jgi:hypothetical protein
LYFPRGRFVIERLRDLWVLTGFWIPAIQRNISWSITESWRRTTQDFKFVTKLQIFQAHFSKLRWLHTRRDQSKEKGRMPKASEDDRTKSELKATLRDLSALHGISGFEQTVIRYTRDRFGAVVDDVEIDHYGNITGTKRGHHKGPVLMLSAHMDEIGFIVKGVEPTGFLRFDRIGGAGDGLLGCRKVEVNGRFGLIGSISGHLGSAEMLARVTPISELYIDVGASSAAEVAV